MLRAFHHRPIHDRLYLLMLLEFLFGIVYGAFSLTLPILSEHIFANIAVLGIVFALPELFGTLIDIPLGAFANRFGRRRTIFLSGILLACAAFLFLTLRHPVLFILALIFYELATQSFIVPADAEQVALTPNRRAGRFNGLAEGIHNLGFSIGPLLAGMLLSYHLEYAFLLALVISLLMAFISFLFLPQEAHREPLWRAAEDVWRRDHVYIAGIREFRMLGFLGKFLLVVFFTFAFHWGFIALLGPLYTTALGLNEFSVGLIYAGFTIPILFISILTGKLIDRRGAKGVLVGGLFLMALSMIGFGVSTNPKVLFLFSLVSGVGDAFILPAVMTLLDQLASYRVKEKISGVKVFAESAGYFVGPLVAGVVTAAVGFQNSFLYLGFGILALTVTTLFVPIARPAYAETAA